MGNNELKSQKSLYISFSVGVILLSAGLILNQYGYIGLGNAIFLGTPFAIGLVSGILPNLQQAIGGTLISLLIFGITLYFSGQEGMICIILATPILLAAVFIGWWLGQKLKRDKEKGKKRLQLSFYPLMVIAMVSIFELFSGSDKLPGKVTSSVVLEASPSAIYQEIIAVDTVIVNTNLLHKMGLPTPTKCILTEEKVGGLRLCLFKEGRIVETITALEKDRLLQMDVTEFNLGKARNWLAFDEDIYEIKPLDNKNTQITRTTTYSSSLRPRWYWEFMETLTISSEQDFVFRNLQHDIQQK